MVGTVLEIDKVMKADWLGDYIGEQYSEWDSLRTKWLEDKLELTNYLYATDTRTTSNATLPWKNSTTLPKLTQIMDNLHANYLSTLFPNDDWLRWEGDDEDSETEQKAQTIVNYMKAKLRQMDFTTIIDKLILDYIIYGNLFVTTEFVTDYSVSDEGDKTTTYTGPMPIRMSPYDVVFNPMAVNFDKSPKIHRQLLSLGELASKMQEVPDSDYLQDAMDKIVERRRGWNQINRGDNLKGRQYVFDGFSDMKHYFSSQYIEVLEFHGDYYNVDEGKLYKNRIVTVVDKCQVIRNVSNPSWTGTARVKHSGWRNRPDNLYAMGPLDNLVGMQYRIDHLENLRADVFDMIGYPMLKITGQVEEFDYGPNERIYVGEDGDVSFMAPDGTVLQADTQIALLEQRMEELAGAPKQAMGIRTPGEKTKYEVQVLDNASSRIYQNRVSYFERTVLEPLLNDMLELARRNMDGSETIRVLDDEFGTAVFETITKEDLTVKGKLRPQGARHFARRANMLQDLSNFANSALGQDPAVSSHISGLKTAKLIEDLLGLEKFDLVEENIRVSEEVTRQRLISAAQQTLDEEGALPSQEAPVEV